MPVLRKIIKQRRKAKVKIVKMKTLKKIDSGFLN